MKRSAVAICLASALLGSVAFATPAGAVQPQVSKTCSSVLSFTKLVSMDIDLALASYDGTKHMKYLVGEAKQGAKYSKYGQNKNFFKELGKIANGDYWSTSGNVSRMQQLVGKLFDNVDNGKC